MTKHSITCAHQKKKQIQDHLALKKKETLINTNPRNQLFLQQPGKV